MSELARRIAQKATGDVAELARQFRKHSLQLQSLNEYAANPIPFRRLCFVCASREICTHREPELIERWQRGLLS